jgi:hypothetical protein
MHRTCSYKTTMQYHSVRASQTLKVTKVTLCGISGSLSRNCIHAAYFCCMLLSLVSRYTLYVHFRHCGKVVCSCASYLGCHGFDPWYLCRLSLLKSLVLVLIFCRPLLGFLFQNRPPSYEVRH